MPSRQARALQTMLRFIRMRDLVSRKIGKEEVHNQRIRPPRSIARKYRIQRKIIGKTTYFSLHKNPSDVHILYFPGGAYTLPPGKLHWNILSFLMERLAVRATLVNYPLYPESTCKEALDQVEGLYKALCENREKIILMGDSAGAGLLLALAQLINQSPDLKRPVGLILFSPWLDVSMKETPPKSLQSQDLILKTGTLQEIGRKYAGDMSEEDWRCSPLYGNVTGLPPVALFTGTSDILNPQARNLKEKITQAGGILDYHEYEDLQHVFVGFPIPEAYDALHKTIALIQEFSSESS